MEKRHVLSPAEKWLVVKCHQYFVEHKAMNLPGMHASVRDSVSKCLGFAKSTVSNVVANRERPSYASQVIATSHGYTLLLTPPYHPELQPIEVIWGIVKNKIACRPSSDMEDLERRLKTNYADVTLSHWVSAHNKCCSFEDAYMEAAENEILVLEAEPSEEADGNLLEASSESE
ncbi:hypothetical protein DYB32_010266 [Aphanomyces invadans]|uniref:Tc1-like transposase DDE domain-containing protein n=1 Tax=Aphanomyces invadans TaxID=157072 RepID=A0A418AGE2_9STRA|nr:hypothetical protein DYB32_010266 [Aphanomyces invadans]